MGKFKYKIFTIVILLAVGFLIGVGINKERDFIGLKVTKWDNIYTEKNIKLYYNNSDKQVLKDLNEKFALQEIIKGTEDEFDKSLKILNLVIEKMKYKSNLKTDVINKGVFDILEGENKKQSYSDEEICIVFNELALASGVYSRIGKFTPSHEAGIKDKNDFSVCEIWSTKFNKWIIIDPSNGNYIVDKDVPVSAIELLEKGIESFEVIGEKSESKYKKDLVEYLQAYTIKIDNGVYGIKKSNSYISFSKGINKDNLGVNINLSMPTIFLNSAYLFNISPKEEYKIANSSEKSTLIFSTTESNSAKDENVKMELIAGVFKDSAMVEKYYVSINNEPFKEQSQYFTIKIKSGLNNIKLSEDGKTVIRDVTFEYVDKK